MSQSLYTHMGSLTPYTHLPALRILHGYFSALDSLDFDTNDSNILFADNAAFFDSTNNVYRSCGTIWDGIKARFEKFEFMHHQACITRVMGPDVRSLNHGERHVVSVQAIMLCRLKDWEEERTVEIPRMFEFVIGKVEEPASESTSEEEQQDDIGEEAEAPQSKRGYQGLHIYEARVWWDTGVLTKAIQDKAKEEERQRFREIMTMNNGFLGQRPRR